MTDEQRRYLDWVVPMVEFMTPEQRYELFRRFAHQPCPKCGRSGIAKTLECGCLIPEAARPRITAVATSAQGEADSTG